MSFLTIRARGTHGPRKEGITGSSEETDREASGNCCMNSGTSRTSSGNVIRCDFACSQSIEMFLRIRCSLLSLAQ
jgi:hypothetical protein